MIWSISREPDDRLASVRISLGRTKPQHGEGAYIVFRGEPLDAVDLLDLAAAQLRSAIRNGTIDDKR